MWVQQLGFHIHSSQRKDNMTGTKNVYNAGMNVHIEKIFCSSQHSLHFSCHPDEPQPIGNAFILQLSTTALKCTVGKLANHKGDAIASLHHDFIKWRIFSHRQWTRPMFSWTGKEKSTAMLEHFHCPVTKEYGNVLTSKISPIAA